MTLNQVAPHCLALFFRHEKGILCFEIECKGNIISFGIKHILCLIA